MAGAVGVDPLAYPRDRRLLEQFRAGVGLSAESDARDQLNRLARAFATLPYENLTKIIKDAARGNPASARRAPHEVLADHQRWRTGGSCFSLTATLLHLVRSLGLRAEPILADRSYGTDTHCALIVWLDNRPHLLDPGYLLVEPVPLDASSGSILVTTDFNQVELVPAGPERLELHTIDQQARRRRLTFKTSPVDESQFRRAWDASFDWDMMRYPLLTRVSGGQQLYLRGGHFQRRSAATIQRETVSDQLLVKKIAGEFGIHADVVRQALDILRRGGT